jgi:hypothetical protein
MGKSMIVFARVTADRSGLASATTDADPTSTTPHQLALLMFVTFSGIHTAL